VAFILTSLFALSYLVTELLGLPGLGLPLAARVVGVALVVVGLGVAGWIFLYRSPAAMALSTYVTLTKLFSGAPVEGWSGRKENLVVAGPQRYVRHPLYLGVILLTFGWALEGSYTFVLIGAVALLLWFWLVLIPFEEKELRALFGELYVEYARGVPTLVPFTKWKGRSGPEARKR
jgi:protein-S-isoprenylcysteine O-methyltransferase Ste14